MDKLDLTCLFERFQEQNAAGILHNLEGIVFKVGKYQRCAKLSFEALCPIQIVQHSANANDRMHTESR